MNASNLFPFIVIKAYGRRTRFNKYNFTATYAVCCLSVGFNSSISGFHTVYFTVPATATVMTVSLVRKKFIKSVF